VKGGGGGVYVGGGSGGECIYGPAAIDMP